MGRPCASALQQCMGEWPEVCGGPTHVGAGRRRLACTSWAPPRRWWRPTSCTCRRSRSCVRARHTAGAPKSQAHRRGQDVEIPRWNRRKTQSALPSTAPPTGSRAIWMLRSGRASFGGRPKAAFSAARREYLEATSPLCTCRREEGKKGEGGVCVREQEVVLARAEGNGCDLLCMALQNGHRLAIGEAPLHTTAQGHGGIATQRHRGSEKRW